LGSEKMIRVALGTFVAVLAGAICGFAAQWPVALLSMRLYGAGYSDTTPRWDPAFATFDAASHGAPIGGVLAVAGYLLFLKSFPPGLVVRSIPTLFAFSLLGALPGIWFGPGDLFSVVPLFLLGCIVVARRLSRRTAVTAHPFL
jgi:hypothetical protein